MHRSDFLTKVIDTSLTGLSEHRPKPTSDASTSRLYMTQVIWTKHGKHFGSERDDDDFDYLTNGNRLGGGGEL